MKKIVLIITMLVATTSVFAQLDPAYYNRTGLSPRNPYGWFDSSLIVGNYPTTTTGDTLFHMGNSLTVGVGSTGGQTYPEQLKTLTGKPYYNFGIGGTKLVQTSVGDSSCVDRLYRIPLRNTIGAYVLEYSTNDVFANQSIAKIRNNWLKTIAYMVGNSIDTRKIILLGNSRDYRYQTNQTLAFSTDTCLRNICKETGVNYISLRDLVINNGGLTILTSDSLHLNNTGYGIMASAIYAKLPFVVKNYNRLNVSGNLRVDSNIVAEKAIIANGVNTTNLLVSQSASIQNWLRVDSINTPRLVADSLNLNTGGKILFNGTSTGNKILYYDDGSSSTRIGAGYNIGISHSIFSFGSLPILFGMNLDANTMTTSNAAFYVNTNNQLNWRNSVAGTLSWGAALVTGRNNILFYDGGSTSTRYGVGVNSNKLAFYTSLADTMAFGGGTDGSNTFGVSAAMYVQNNKLNINSMGGTLNWGTSLVTNRNNVLFYDGGSTSTRYGIGANANKLAVYTGTSDTLMFGNGFDGSNANTANGGFWIRQNIANFRLAPKVVAFNAAGIVQNGSNGDLSSLANGSNGQVLTVSGGVPSWQTVGYSNGTYTPTITTVSNITSATVRNVNYIKVGNTVTVSVGLQITPTATATLTALRVTTPTAVVNNSGSGVVTGGPAFNYVAGNSIDANLSEMSIAFMPTSTTDGLYCVHFTYQTP